MKLRSNKSPSAPTPSKAEGLASASLGPNDAATLPAEPRPGIPASEAANTTQDLLQSKPVPYQQLPLETQTLYAELLEYLLTVEAMRTMGSLKGTFQVRERNNQSHIYFRTSEGGQGRQEFYLGPDSPETREIMRGYESSRPVAEEAQKRSLRLATMVRGGGAATTDRDTEKILHSLAQAGMFRLGGVLIGTHAFAAIGNAMGVRWASHLRTQDVDFGTLVRTPNITFGLPSLGLAATDIPAAIDALKMGFIPHINLHTPHHHTSFVIDGQEHRIDLLTYPQGTDRTKPVFIPKFKAHAEPLEYMDYLLEGTFPGVVLGPKQPILVTLPDPARFALHKLLISGNRSTSQAAKAPKDRAQARIVLSFLAEERPDDVGRAVEALHPKWRLKVAEQMTKVTEGSRLSEEYPHLFELLKPTK